MKQQKVIYEGLVTQLFPNGMFYVCLDNADVILGYISRKIRRSSIRILFGDRVKIEVSRYYSTKGHIIYRLPCDNSYDQMIRRTKWFSNFKIPSHENVSPDARTIPKAVTHVQAGFHNTILTIADVGGQVVSWDLISAYGFRVGKRGTPLCGSSCGAKCYSYVNKQGMQEVEVKIKGPDHRRD
ncbi:hypothetical protein Cgig2_012954 [Carnegiea gigantea]|uniref:S1-like domain-containing protein n=1 Tax=Carnegiea gigantea TaxID=171969 RepID=A0A9Q1GQE6_9CARY|nr:hypothetical protein Cgig2_012954 [Carnegiea gigantea]